MADDKFSFGNYEELILLAIIKLGPDAYGASIYETLEEAGAPTSVGALYTALSRLEEKGAIRSRVGEATQERGGRSKKYFAVEGTALQALKDRHSVRTKLIPVFVTGGDQ
jgi:PadR family transcriptional regulator, regulatory protein PadR